MVKLFKALHRMRPFIPGSKVARYDYITFFCVFTAKEPNLNQYRICIQPIKSQSESYQKTSALKNLGHPLISVYIRLLGLTLRMTGIQRRINTNRQSPIVFSSFSYIEAKSGTGLNRLHKNDFYN